MTQSRLAPSVVVDLSRLELDRIRLEEGNVVLGATTTYRHLVLASREETAQPLLSWLGAVASGITGGAQIRNRGTVGGSAAFSNPSSDVPALLVALDAELSSTSSHGSRSQRAEDFFSDAFTTSLHDEDLLVSIRIPAGEDGTSFGYEKLKFGESSWPIVTAAAVVRPSGSARVAVGGCCPVPIAVEVDRAADVAEAIATSITEPWSDVLADGTYRRRVAPVVAGRAANRAA